MNSRRAVAKTIELEGDMQVFIRGNYTIAVISWQNYQGIGVAKCNPSDEYNETLGRRKSLGRALTDITDQVWEKRQAVLCWSGSEWFSNNWICNP